MVPILKMLGLLLLISIPFVVIYLVKKRSFSLKGSSLEPADFISTSEHYEWENTKKVDKCGTPRIFFNADYVTGITNSKAYQRKSTPAYLAGINAILEDENVEIEEGEIGIWNQYSFIVRFSEFIPKKIHQQLRNHLKTPISYL